ncbi:hypothetical protein ACO0RG_004618 [Hanseniaspora osmophila]
MSVTVLPGQPNDTQQAVCQANWQGHTILSYCSGNNVVVVTSQFRYFQTIYLSEDCHCCDLDEDTGFLAIGVSSKVVVYKPLSSIFTTKTPPKWVYCCTISQPNTGTVNCVKWSRLQSQKEIVIGSTYLSLWKIQDVYGEYKQTLLWTKLQSCPVYRVDITQDSQLICSMGKYDKTVRVWKRITLGTDASLFEVSILNHGNSAYVTSFRWKLLRQNWSDNESYSYVLYTLMSDKTLHIWTVYSLNNRKTIEIWGQINFDSGHRFAFIVDNCLLKSSRVKTDSDFLFTSDEKGHFDVYQMSHLSDNPPKLMKMRQHNRKVLVSGCFPLNANFLYFPEIKQFDSKDNCLSFIIHDVSGSVWHFFVDPQNLIAETENFEGSKPQEIEAEFQQVLTGHFKSIQKLVRSSDGESVLSLSRYASENCLWLPYKNGEIFSLRKFKVLQTEVPIKEAILLEKGKLAVLLLQNGKLQVWRSSENGTLHSTLMSTWDTLLANEPVLFVNVPTKVHNHDKHFIVLVYKDGSCKCFRIEHDKIHQVECESLTSEKIFNISAIDPVSYTYNGDRSIISVASVSGVIRCFKGVFETGEIKLKWAMTFEVMTGRKNITKFKGSSIDKMCCVDESQREVTIWDLKRGVLEYTEVFKEKVLDIDWTSSYGNMSIFSLGFLNHALSYTQVRYDYTHDYPSYAPIRKTDMTKYTSHAMGDSLWLGRGLFMIAAGNQILLKNKGLDLEHDPTARQTIGSRDIRFKNIFHLSGVLNGPLPVYHPQFLVQALYMGKINLVKEIMLKLLNEIRNCELLGASLHDLNSYLKLEPWKFLLKSDLNYTFDTTYEEPFDKFNSTLCQLLREKLTKTTLPDLTRHQQVTLITIIETLEKITNLGNSVDSYGINFIMGTKLYQSHKQSQPSITMRDVSWAVHCNQKDIIFSELNDIRMQWDKAKELKLAYWLSQDDLVVKTEQIAKMELSKNDERDPNACAIFYLALKKKHVLLGLWRICTGHPEQKKMLNFLNHDFSEDRWKTAALKNSYVLLSKHRDMMAACFFLLAGSLRDCVNVLVRKINDLDLAILVCRLFEGDNGPVLAEMLIQHILPSSISNNDRWSASFVYWKLKKKDLAIKSLIEDPAKLEGPKAGAKKIEVVNESFMVDDPVLLMMYMKLRNTHVTYFNSTLTIEESLEYNTLEKVCEVYRRLGCDYLALSLMKNWQFIDKQKLIKNENRQFTSTADSGLNEVPLLRPSLFDKFSQSWELPPSSSKETNVPVKSVFDGFGMSTDNVKSEAKCEQKENKWDGVNDPSNPSNDLGSYTNSKSTTSLKTHQSGPKNILDDFMQIPMTSNNSKGSEDSSSALEKSGNGKPSTVSLSASCVDSPHLQKYETSSTSQPRNLLDDFM